MNCRNFIRGIFPSRHIDKYWSRHSDLKTFLWRDPWICGSRGRYCLKSCTICFPEHHVNQLAASTRWPHPIRPQHMLMLSISGAAAAHSKTSSSTDLNQSLQQMFSTHLTYYTKRILYTNPHTQPTYLAWCSCSDLSQSFCIRFMSFRKYSGPTAYDKR